MRGQGTPYGTRITATATDFYFGENHTQLVSVDYNYEDRKDEIGELHQRFDQMANQIRELIQKRKW